MKPPFEISQVTESGGLATRDMLSIHLGLPRGDAQVHSTGRGLAISLRRLTENGRIS